ncbi:B12-binding domain-containing radical SAM protein [Candidatus Woesearchaeota archaeon]|nr:B12-binding domain-containing radical SAM protein [Candidatus Woesearchaeota archaeon]
MGKLIQKQINFDKSKDEICLVSYLGQNLDEWAFFPIGTALISAVLKKENYKVKVLDLDMFPDLKPEISNYKIIMFGLSAGPCLKFALDKIEELKTKEKDKIVIVSGVLSHALPKQVLEETKADFLLYGDIEESVIKLLEFLEGKGELEKINGLSYRKKNEIMVNPPQIIKDIGALPFPDLHSFDTESYIKNIDFKLGVRSINWYTSRGCNFDCQFCSHLRNWRGYNAERMVSDLKYLKENYDIGGVWFFDDNFMTSPKRINEFCDLMIKENVGVKWGCESRVTSINEEIVSKMKAAGCVTIRNGLESGSDRILKVMHKAATVQDAKDAILLMTKLDMPIKGAFIFGSPTETIEDAKQTLKFIKWIYNVNPKSNLRTCFFTPRPNTPWYDLAIKQGMKEFSVRDWADVYAHEGIFFNMSKITEKQMRKLMRRVELYKFLAKPNKIKKIFKKANKVVRPKLSFLPNILKGNSSQYTSN